MNSLLKGIESLREYIASLYLRRLHNKGIK